MAARLLSLFFAVATSAMVSVVVWVTALWFGNFYDQTRGGAPLPGISHYFYPSATGIYYFPVVLFLYGTLTVIRWRHNADLCNFCCVVALGTTLMFMSVAGFALALPFLPVKIYGLDRTTP